MHYFFHSSLQACEFCTDIFLNMSFCISSLPLCIVGGHWSNIPPLLPLHHWLLSTRSCPLDGKHGVSCIQLFVTTWTTGCQAPLFMGFSSQEYWNGLPFPSPQNLPESAIEPASFALAGGFFTTSATLAPSLGHPHWKANMVLVLLSLKTKQPKKTTKPFPDSTSLGGFHPVSYSFCRKIPWNSTQIRWVPSSHFSSLDSASCVPPCPAHTTPVHRTNKFHAMESIAGF